MSELEILNNTIHANGIYLQRLQLIFITFRLRYQTNTIGKVLFFMFSMDILYFRNYLYALKESGTEISRN